MLYGCRIPIYCVIHASPIKYYVDVPRHGWRHYYVLFLSPEYYYIYLNCICTPYLCFDLKASQLPEFISNNAESGLGVVRAFL